MLRAPKLRAARERRALSQAELAKLAQVSKGTIVRIESGADAHPPTVRKLAEALDVEPSELMETERN
jgi:transcriptional regulator with XRE-family HTH domain